MANILIVHAHPEPKSFSSALARTAAETFAAEGHSVEVSDLYALGFDPVSSRKNFTTVANPDFLKPQAEERHASEHAGFAPELETEIRKLEACDVLVFSFPLWWFGMPAILKGWVDRVFAMGRIYGGGKLYENGIGRGKRAFVIFTTGSPDTAYRLGSTHAPLETLLAPIHRGVFWFNGYSSLGPFATWGAAHLSQDERKAELGRLKRRLQGVLQEPVPILTRLEECDPETWTDTKPHLLVSVTREGPVQAFSEADLAALQGLRREGKVVRALLPKPGTSSWRASLELRADDEATARTWLQELSFLKDGALEFSELDLVTENDLSPHWARPDWHRKGGEYLSPNLPCLGVHLGSA